MSNKDKIINIQLWLIALLLLIIPVTSAYAKIDFSTMLSALQKNAGPIIRLVVATAYVIGLWFIISAIQALKQVGQSQTMMSQSHGALSGPIVKLIIGILLLYLPTTIDIGVWTLWGHTGFGSEAESYMAYSPSTTDFAPVKQGAIAIVRVVGYVSFVRGLIILSRSGSQGAQQGTFGKGALHVIGGMLAINIVETIRIIGNTLGITTI